MDVVWEMEVVRYQRIFPAKQGFLDEAASEIWIVLLLGDDKAEVVSFDHLSD